MTDTERALSQLLAAVDATWEPLRDDPRRAGQCAAQETYRKVGVVWECGGGTDAQRKAAQRLLSRLEADGLVAVAGRGVGRRAMVWLTDKGLALARAQEGLPGLDESLVVLRKAVAIGRKKGRPDPYRAGLRFPEDELAKELGCDVRRLELLALPALEKGWLTSVTTGAGEVGYYVTLAGREALAEQEETPDVQSVV